MSYEKYELYKEDNLLIDEEAVMFAPKAEEYGNVYGVDGAGLMDLPTLNDIISDNMTIADVAAAVNGMIYYFDQAGCRCGEVLDIQNFDVVYSPKMKEFISTYDMNTYPVYMYWDRAGFGSKESFKCIWLPEPDAIVEIEEEDEEPFSLDRWDGNNFTYGGVGCHAEYYPICRLNGDPAEDKYLLRYWSQRVGDEPSGEIVSSEELEKIKAGE